jgi:tetratricopeptide (TPR) repeat protein
MRFTQALLIFAASLVAVPAIAGVTAIGSTSARTCFEAAEAGSTALLATCDKALKEEALSFEDIVATHVNRGILRLRKGQVQAAIADFDEALTRDPEQPEAYLNKAAALLRREGTERAALPLFTAALEKKTRKPAVAFFGRGMAHEEIGNVKSAYLDYRRASLADPKWNEPRLALARFKVR